MRSGINLGDLLERAVDLDPDAMALHCGDLSESYAEFFSKVRRLASSLGARGLGPGDRVCVLSPNCHRIVELYWALVLIGASAVPLEPRLTADEINYIVEATRPKVVVASNWEALDLDVSFEYLEIATEPGDGGRLDLDGLCMGIEVLDLKVPVMADSPALIMYTAAVTGRPRGAVLTHRNLIAQVSQTGEVFGLTAKDVHGLLLPLSHTFGAYLMFVAMARGVPTMVVSNFDADEVVRRIDQGRISFFAEFAPMGQRILDAAAEAQVTLAGKLRVVTGLEVPETIARYQEAGVDFYCLYGQTETAGLVCAARVEAGSIVSNYSGRALSISRLSLRDDQGEIVSPGEPGELWVRGDCVVNSYWPDEPTNLTEDGWLKTGDLLSSQPHGELYFYGRVGARDLIKPGGLNVYPAEVEQVLLRHPRVAAALVFGTPDPTWREKVVAVVAVIDDPAGAEAELISYATQNLASFKRPKVIVVDQGLLVDGHVDAEHIRAKYANL
ncbi:class I adenylate-forming enzyme family protein [Ferrimicrobium sp.]|uniref:class I adenylate-forming enzyme family protein n=1 Tax=Ferrimicrobium sp. TaxID=2926050 RepID=UPI002630A7B7|nr:AMP-binding protein [Ferrimicrobium sp.]